MCSRTYNVDYLVLLFLFCPLLLASNTLYKRTKTTKKKTRTLREAQALATVGGILNFIVFHCSFVYMHASVRSNVPRGVCTAGETWRVSFFFLLLFLFLTKTNRPADEERRWHDGKRSSDGSAQTCIAEGNPLSTRRRCRRRGASQSMPSTQANEPKGNKPKNTRLR